LGEIEYSHFQGERILVEGAYGFNGSIYNIPPKEVVRMIAFMGIMYACNKYFVGSICHATNIVMHPQKWAKVWYSYILRSCEVHYKNIFQYLDHLMGVPFLSFE
jgi:hypothetical protein